MKSHSRVFSLTVIFLLIILSPAQPASAQAPDPAEQTMALLDDELRTVYLGNLARQEHGVPPLRWPSERVPALRLPGALWGRERLLRVYHAGGCDRRLDEQRGPPRQPAQRRLRARTWVGASHRLWSARTRWP
jgi:hypothetical protein